jgi:hypothetical protein
MIKDIALSALVIFFVILIFLILISMAAGPLYILSNITIGLFLGKITFEQCMIAVLACFGVYAILIGVLNIMESK